jgi:PAS domain S-box-containing protein
MSVASLPSDESARLRALRQLALLDSASESRFDRLTALAARAFDVPIAQINLIDEKRQWSKSSFGLATGQVERGASFCAHTILERDALIVSDATQDDRFRENPYVVGDPKVRFYAGYPLVHGKNGMVVGTLCLVDRRPRFFTESDKQLLADLAAVVCGELKNRALELLMESEERLNVLLTHSESGFFDDHYDKGVCYLSPRWKEILGYADGELVNRYETFRSLVHPEDVARVEVALTPRRAGISPFNFEARMRHKEGRWIFVESRGVVTGDENLKLMRHLGFLTEITARRTSLERLRLLEICFDRMGQGVLVTDAEFAPARLSILDANPAFEKLTGYRRGELLGRDPEFLLGPYQSEAALFERLFREQKPYHFKGESPRKDGSMLRGSWTVTPLPDAMGRLTHLVTSLRNLDEVEASDREESLVELLGGAFAVRRPA